MRPTLFAGVNNRMTIARDEIFGPVLCVIPYQDEAEAIAIANDTEYGLSAMVLGGDVDRARRVAQQIVSGRVLVNTRLMNRKRRLAGLSTPAWGARWASGDPRVYGAEVGSGLKLRSLPKHCTFPSCILSSTSQRETIMIAVLFEAKAAPAHQGALQLAAELKPLLADIDGFIDIERFQSLTTDGKILSFPVAG